MADIPVAVLRQTALPVSDIPAAMRAYMVCSSGGALVALLIAPTLILHVGLFAVTLGCGVIIVATGVGGLLLLGWGDLETSASESD